MFLTHIHATGNSIWCWSFDNNEQFYSYLIKDIPLEIMLGYLASPQLKNPITETAIKIEIENRLGK